MSVPPARLREVRQNRRHHLRHIAVAHILATLLDAALKSCARQPEILRALREIALIAHLFGLPGLILCARLLLVCVIRLTAHRFAIDATRIRRLDSAPANST